MKQFSLEYRGSDRALLVDARAGGSVRFDRDEPDLEISSGPATPSHPSSGESVGGFVAGSQGDPSCCGLEVGNPQRFLVGATRRSTGCRTWSPGLWGASGEPTAFVNQLFK